MNAVLERPHPVADVAPDAPAEDAPALDFSAALQANMRLVYYLCNKMSRSFGPAHDEEDAIQEGRIGLWMALTTFDATRGMLGAYLAAHVEWRLLSLLKRHRRRPLLQAPLLHGDDGDYRDEWLAQIPDHRGQPEADTDNDSARQVASLLSLLPKRYQIVVRLHYLEERSFQEIGETLGVSRSRAEQLHERAMARLRQLAVAGKGKGEG